MKKADNVISFAESLIGVKYVRWEKGKKIIIFTVMNCLLWTGSKWKGCVVPASLIY